MAGGFSVTVSAIDNVTKSIDQINKKFASMTAPVTRLNKSLSKFSDVTGLSKMTAGVTALGSRMTHVARSATAASAPLAAITSAASVAGLVALTEHFANFGSQVRFASQNIGIQVDSLAALQGAASLAGASGNSLTSGMLNLSQAITDAGGGRNMDALGYFRQLGINIRDTTGALRTADQVLPDVADGIAKISNPALQRRVAAAFGLSDDLLPFLRRGSQGLREYEAEARRYGAINEAGAMASNSLREAQARLTLSAEGLGNAVAVKLAPVLTPMLTDLANWVAAHRTDIAGTVGGIAKEFSAWAEKGGMKELGVDLSAMAGNIDAVAKAMGGWKTSIELLGAVMVANLLAPLAGVLATMTKLVIAFPGAFAVAAVTLGAGEEAGRMNMPMVDDYGRKIGSWSGGDGSGPPQNWAPGKASNGLRGEDAVDEMNRRSISGRLSAWWSNLTMPRGIRNNNPLNLSYVPGQGALGSDGKFGQYGSMEAGIAASTRQLLQYQKQGDNTLIKIIRRWAPHTDENGNVINDTAGYITDVSEETGFEPNQQLNLSDPSVMARVERAMAMREDGRRYAPGADVFDRGVSQGMAGPYSGSPAPAGGGTSKVEVMFKNAPPGTTVTSTSTGNVSTTAHVATSSLTNPN